MRILPTAILVFLLLIPLVLPVRALDETIEIIGTIDENEPSWGEDINIERDVEIEPGGDVSIGSITAGPKTDQLKFPTLNELTNVTSESLPFLLPADLIRQLSLPVPGEQVLKGQIFHPVCRVQSGGKNLNPTGNPSEGASKVEAPPFWSQLLATTKLAQAIGVPGFSSGVKFQIQPFKELSGSHNEPRDNCPDPDGTTDGPTETSASRDSTIVRFDAIKSLVSFFEDLIGGLLGKKTEEVKITIKPKKFIQGEAEFAEQTGEEFGFLRSFCLQDQCPEKTSELETTPYVGGEENVPLEYRGVAGARKGYDILVQSLYPAELQGLRPLPPTPPLPPKPGTGIFKAVGNPNSTKLEIKILQAAGGFGVPPAVLAGVAWVEGGHMWGYSDSQITAYSAPGSEEPKQCQPNDCAARGPMQITYGVADDCLAHTGKFLDSWSGVSNAYNEATGENRKTNICNIADSIYAAAKLLKAKVGSTQSANWTQEEVFRAVGRYYGDECRETHDRLGNKSYCQFVWDNYR